MSNLMQGDCPERIKEAEIGMSNGSEWVDEISKIMAVAS